MDYPKFSVLMSVYYKENPVCLKESIESLINQTVLPSEILIVKDGILTDELNKVLSQYVNNKLFNIVGYKTNKGLGLALNYGVNLCKYDIVARMDSDDICDKKRFEKQLDYLIKHPNIKLIGSNTIEFIDNINNHISNRIMPENNAEIIEYSKTRNPFVHPSIMTYKDVILKSGNFRNYYLCEDYDMWVRILENGYEAYNIQENLVYMRVSKDFYKRRGGIKYCKAIVKFKKELYKKGYMTYGKYFMTKYATIIVSLMPGFIRKYIYKKFLRKK